MTKKTCAIMMAVQVDGDKSGLCLVVTISAIRSLFYRERIVKKIISENVLNFQYIFFVTDSDFYCPILYYYFWYWSAGGIIASCCYPEQCWDQVLVYVINPRLYY